MFPRLARLNPELQSQGLIQHIGISSRVRYLDGHGNKRLRRRLTREQVYQSIDRSLHLMHTPGQMSHVKGSRRIPHERLIGEIRISPRGQAALRSHTELQKYQKRIKFQKNLLRTKY